MGGQGLGSVRRGGKGIWADETERKIQKLDSESDRRETSGRGSAGEGSGNGEEWTANSFEVCISCTV